jgi:hypothetical protein
MNPRIRRILITGSVLVLALGVVLIMVLGPKPPQTGPAPAAATAPQTGAPDQPGEPAAADGADTSLAETSEPPPGQTEVPVESIPLEPQVGRHVVPAPADTAAPPVLGSLDPRRHKLLLEFSSAGAGLDRITLSEFWQTAEQSRRARAHYRALDRREPNPPPLPPDTDRYVLQTSLPYDWLDTSVNLWRQTDIPVLAAHSVVINGSTVSLLDTTKPLWSVVSRNDTQVTFEASIADEGEQPIARITRTWSVGGGYDLICTQRITNLTDAPLQVQWIQYGPGDLIVDRSRYMDRRRLTARGTWTAGGFDSATCPIPSTCPT